MRPQSCKAKGRRLQQLIVTDLLAAFPELHADDVRSTSMGAGGEDIQLSQAARKLLPYSFEAKNQERVNIWSAMSQARTNAPAGTDAVVVMKKNQERPHVMISWDLFRRLIAPHMDSEVDAKESLLRMSSEMQRLANAL